MKIESLQDLILENQEQILEVMNATLDPVFKGNIKPELYLNEVGRYVNFKRPLIPKQAEEVAAIEAFYKNNSSCIASLDTGYGKTTVATAVASHKDYKNIVITVPPHLVNKWAREIKVILGDRFEYEIVIVNSYKDLIPLSKKGKPNSKKTFYIISKNKNANSYTTQNGICTIRKGIAKEVRTGQTGSTVVKWREYRYQCIKCGKAVFSPFKMFNNDGTPTNPQRGIDSKITECPHCKEKLVQPLKSTISPSEYLKRYGRYKCIDLLIIDEIHEEKAKDTLRSMAMGRLMPKSKKVLGLTGTFLGGYASHAFYTLFRMFPKLFIKDLQFTWEDVKEFTQEFGGHETLHEVTSYDPVTLQVSGIGRSYGIKERADLSPRLLDIILPMVIFGRLDEIKYLDKDASLPPYTEISHLVEIEPDLKVRYDNYCKQLAEVSSYEMRNYGTRVGFGKLKVDALLIPDLPFESREITLKDKDGPVKIQYKPKPRARGQITNKEAKLLEIINTNLSQGRKCLVYHDFVNSGLREELLRVIRANSTSKVEQLTSKVPAAKREQYIADLDCNVLLANPELVKTGLDLLEYPTIIFYEQSYSNYNVFTLRQAAKRAWRIGQKEFCEVHSIAYSATSQQKALQLMGAKMNISQGVEGRLSTGDDIASEAEDENMQIAMARAILSNNQEASTSSTISSTLDLNQRDWSVFESFYISHLEKYREDPSLYDSYIPVYEYVQNEQEVIDLDIEAAKVSSTEIIHHIIDEEDVTATYEEQECVNKEYTIFKKVKKGRKTVEVAEVVDKETFDEYLQSEGSIQMSLFDF